MLIICLLTVFWICVAALLHTYIFYPLMAALIGGTKQNTSDMTDLPGISVLVPAFNEEDVIDAKIDNFLNLDYPSEKIELIIVDDGSSDRTREIIERKLQKNIKLLDPAPRAGKATGLNRMFAESSHPFLLMCDANVMFSPDVPKRLVRHMKNRCVGAVTGEVRLIGSNPEFESGESLYYMLERRIQSAESRLGSVMGVDGGMYLLRKKLYSPLPPESILDDFIISMQVIRSGHRITYDASIKATESGTPSSSQEYKRRVRIMAGVVQLLRSRLYPRWNQPVVWFQFVSHKVLRWVTPFLLLGCFLSNAASISNNPLHSVLFAIQATVYLVFGLTCIASRLRRIPITSVVFYFFMSQVAIIEGLVKGLTNRQRVLWDKASRV